MLTCSIASGSPNSRTLLMPDVVRYRKPPRLILSCLRIPKFMAHLQGSLTLPNPSEARGPPAVDAVDRSDPDPHGARSVGEWDSGREGGQDGKQVEVSVATSQIFLGPAVVTAAQDWTPTHARTDGGGGGAKRAGAHPAGATSRSSSWHVMFDEFSTHSVSAYHIAHTPGSPTEVRGTVTPLQGQTHGQWSMVQSVHLRTLIAPRTPRKP